MTSVCTVAVRVREAQRSGDVCLYHAEFGVCHDQPFCTGVIEFDLYAGVRAAAFVVDNHAAPKCRVHDVHAELDRCCVAFIMGWTLHCS